MPLTFYDWLKKPNRSHIHFLPIHTLPFNLIRLPEYPTTSDLIHYGHISQDKLSKFPENSYAIFTGNNTCVALSTLSEDSGDNQDIPWITIPCDKPFKANFICSWKHYNSSSQKPQDKNNQQEKQLKTNIPCYKNQFQCKTGMCIHQMYECDGQMDCKTGEDERKCDHLCTFHTKEKCK